ncbi:hypothetical protein GE061_013881 [Apolygus lucorum]|uniref:Rrn7/TAF1B C-terminal cyclin domain-containing protein n=1 Tax=Apolygus lucorum TaxID=248454 RepID=A0A6A4KC32_APOLU|nr:hypothetical protein GE061_013881 [Apolygus lucorum]
MSQKVQCERCGGDDFRLENGFYFCSECQLQTQEIQEQVLEKFYGGHGTVASKVKKDDKKQSLDSSGKTVVSSVEILNFILKGIVDELIALGAPKKLKIITLQLWASYLRKIEMAFTSTTASKKPKLTLWSREGDVARFYKIRKRMSFRYYSSLGRRSKNKGSSGKATSIASSEFDSALGRRRRLNAKRASLARAEYEESCTSMNLSSQAPSLHSFDVSSQSDIGEKMDYSKKGKKEAKELAEQISKHQGDKMTLLRKINRKHKHGMDNPRIQHLFVIVRIALILSGSDIHVGDLFRWIEEGYFSIVSGMKFIPPEITLTSDQVIMLSKAKQTQNAQKLFDRTKEMVDFLGVTNVGLPPWKIVSNLVKRYCRILNLPDNVFTGINALLKLKPTKLWLDSRLSNFEGRAMALIILSLKILIGLDDVTEHNYVPRKGVEGIKWADWCRQYEARVAKKAIHHYPTLIRQYPNSYLGRNQSFLSHWDPATNHLAKTNNRSKTDRALLECFNRVLKPLACKLEEPRWRPGLESEAQSAEPPLAVLSECIDGTIRKGVRTIILEKAIPYKYRRQKVKRRSKDAPNLKVRVVNDDSELKVKSGPEKNEISEEKVKKVIGNEDYSVWVHHNGKEWSCLSVRHMEFAHFAAEKFPRSFWWLLQQTAEIIHQSPVDVYDELIRVEKVYSGRRVKGESW